MIYEADIPLHITKVDGVTITGKGTLRSPLVVPTPMNFGSSTNYSSFESDGTLVAHGDATVWQDIDFPIVIRTTGVGVPTLTAIQGNILVPQWDVNDYSNCEGQELIHSWKEGSTVYWHIHIVTNGVDTTDRYTKWEIEWVWANTNNALSSTIITTSSDILIPANTPNRTHLMLPISLYTFTGKIGGHIYARLKRVASTGTAPTGNPWCSMLQIHVEVDTIGSRLITTK